MEPSTQNSQNISPSASELPPEALALAGRMFEAARKGDEMSVALLTQALQRGLPANLTNDKGDSLVSAAFHTKAGPATAYLLNGLVLPSSEISEEDAVLVQHRSKSTSKLLVSSCDFYTDVPGRSCSHRIMATQI